MGSCSLCEEMVMVHKVGDVYTKLAFCLVGLVKEFRSTHSTGVTQLQFLTSHFSQPTKQNDDTTLEDSHHGDTLLLEDIMLPDNIASHTYTSVGSLSKNPKRFSSLDAPSDGPSHSCQQ